MSFSRKIFSFLSKFGEFLLFVTEFSIFSQKMKILPKNCTKMSVFYWCNCCYIEKICENLSFWLFLAWVLPKTVSFLKFVSSFSSEFFSKRSKKSLVFRKERVFFYLLKNDNYGPASEKKTNQNHWSPQEPWAPPLNFLTPWREGSPWLWINLVRKQTGQSDP